MHRCSRALVLALVGSHVSAEWIAPEDRDPDTFDDGHHLRMSQHDHPASRCGVGQLFHKSHNHYDFRHTILHERDTGKRVHHKTAHGFNCHTIDLGYADIGDDGAEAIAEFLEEDTDCTRLDLHYNHNMGDRGARAIGRMLQSNTMLKQLYLWGNNIGDDGVMVLAAGLRKNSALEELYLNNNHEKIGDLACKYLGRALMTNKHLRILDLRTNSITETGAMYLAVALETNMHLTKLFLFGNHVFDTELMKTIDAALKRNQDALDFKEKSYAQADNVMEGFADAAIEKQELKAAAAAAADAMRAAGAAAANAAAAASDAAARMEASGKQQQHDNGEL